MKTQGQKTENPKGYINPILAIEWLVLGSREAYEEIVQILNN